MTARFVDDEDGWYVFNFHGSPLRVEKSSVKSMVPAGLARTDPASGPGAPGPLPPGLTEDDLRDAVEALAAVEDDAARRAYKLLGDNCAAARTILHDALLHPHPRVRALAVKLLERRGTSRTT